MKCTVIAASLLGISNAIALLPKKEPSFQPDPEDAKLSYVGAAVEPAPNRRCASWSLETTEKEIHYPSCDTWLPDSSQQDDYILVGTRLLHGRCPHWEVHTDGNKIIPHCSGIESRWFTDNLPTIGHFHGTRDAKHEPSFNTHDEPASVLYVDTINLQAGDKRCGEWSLDQNEKSVLWPKCDKWLYEPTKKQPDYVLVGTKVTSGRCEKWTVHAAGIQIIPECADKHGKKPRIIKERQAQPQSEDYSIIEGNAINSQKRGDQQRPYPESSSASPSTGALTPKQLINLIAPLNKKVERLEAQLLQAQGQLRELDPTNPLALPEAKPKNKNTLTKNLSRRQLPPSTSLPFNVPSSATIDSLCREILDLKQELASSRSTLKTHREMQTHQREHPLETEEVLRYGEGKTMTPERPHEPPREEQAAQKGSVLGSSIAEKENGENDS